MIIVINSYHINIDAIAYYQVISTNNPNDWILRINYLYPGYYTEIHYYEDSVFKDLKRLDAAFSGKKGK